MHGFKTELQVKQPVFETIQYSYIPYRCIGLRHGKIEFIAYNSRKTKRDIERDEKLFFLFFVAIEYRTD